jgi:transposase InsO family protein
VILIQQFGVLRGATTGSGGSGIPVSSSRLKIPSSDAIKTPLAVIGANLSMSGRGNCYDNAKAEAFFRTLKTECFRANQLYIIHGKFGYLDQKCLDVTRQSRA